MTKKEIYSFQCSKLDKGMIVREQITHTLANSLWVLLARGPDAVINLNIQKAYVDMNEIDILCDEVPAFNNDIIIQANQ